MRTLYLLLSTFLLLGTSIGQSSTVTKQAIDAQYAQERTLGNQNPAPRDPLATSPSVIESPFETGIIQSDDAPFSADEITVTNRWQGLINGTKIVVYAGAQSDEIAPAQGVAVVMKFPEYPSDVNGAQVVSPSASGALTIVSANGPQLILASTGSHVLALDVTHGTFTSDILDTVPPVISGMPAENCSIWPPNQKFVTIADIKASDAQTGILPGSFTVVATNSESNDSLDPNIRLDSDGNGGITVSVVADRSAQGSGRIYTVTASATDLAGNKSTMTGSCTVPHDQRP